jgi:hypothetical protein
MMRLGQYPALWIVLSLLLLFADLLSGPHIQFPIAFVVPIILAGWNGSMHWALGLAVFLSTARLANHMIWGVDVSILILVINTTIRITVLSIIAMLAYRYGKITKEIKVLKGLLPICMFCKKIRDENNEWQILEKYISNRSDTQFSHGICPDCFVIHYPKI